ncbi:uncharacterized protein LOC127850178 isoform X2 [Dreissena polymorpha]|uniref:Uncharacterized protein n=1 Tax=Dreissena polymorpha TaxID=45954 RepID=A0A9D4D9P0_DREPO|nr:uncharacterized protein LOC127850178 isoform X2 [Dreissena polymorpha]KAH3739803.1 hypothetical protein DPMN_046493 [Dreissena polymorpha]
MGHGIEPIFESQFVGRKDELRDLKAAWDKKLRMFGIFGMRSVGTSRLAKEFLASVSDQYEGLVYVNLKETSDLAAMYVNICAQLAIAVESHPNDVNSWESMLVGAVSTSKRQYVFFFDNGEHFLDKEAETRDPLQNLFMSLIKKNNIKVILTSTTKFQLASLWRIYHVCELQPLTKTETSELLRAETPGVNYGEYLDPIVEMSEGLPLLILMITSELRGDGGMLTPKDMTQLLAEYRLKVLSREFYPGEDRVADVYRLFINRLSPVLQRRFSELDYIPGSFTAEEARSLLDFPTEAVVKDQVLVPKLRRHFLSYDPASRRFNIQGILRECLKTYFALRHIPEIRRRFCQTFTEVMTSISRRFTSPEYESALADFAFEQPNLQKLLLEVQFTTQDNYTFFIRMATESTDFIEKYLAGNSEDFYSQCHRAADRYGKEMDKAVVDLAVGSLYTNIKGNLKDGHIKYSAALSILKGAGKSLQLATAHQRIGYNLMLQDQNEDAINHFKKSLAISLVSGKPFELIALQSLNSMGITLTKLGRFEEAERYHFVSLKRRRKIQGENHPGVGMTLNNIGLMYDQKGDGRLALKYFQEGLEIKKKSKAPDLSRVASLTNVANGYIAVGAFEEALHALDEAEEILSKQRLPQMHDIAYLNDTRGKVYFKQGDMDKAAEMFEKAAQGREGVASGKTAHVESLVNVMKVAVKKGDNAKCIKTGKTVLSFSDDVIKQRPKSHFLTECYDCLAKVYEAMGDDAKVRDTLTKIKTELLRLEYMYTCDCNEGQVGKIRQQLADIESKLMTKTHDEVTQTETV